VWTLVGGANGVIPARRPLRFSRFALEN